MARILSESIGNKNIVREPLPTPQCVWNKSELRCLLKVENASKLKYELIVSHNSNFTTTVRMCSDKRIVSKFPIVYNFLMAVHGYETIKN